MKHVAIILGIGLLAALGGCGKARDAISEKTAEKLVESALETDGAKAKVSLSEGSIRMTTTDASGKTSQFEAGSANITESDVGVPFYPGAKMPDGQSMRIVTPDGTTVSVDLRSDDAPAKVAAFYRERLKARSEGRQFTDMSNADGSAMLALTDGAANSAIRVVVDKADNGTSIQIVAQQAAPK